MRVYKGLLNEDKHGHKRLRVKVNTTGSLSTRLWGPDKKRIPWTKELGEDLRNAKVRPVVCVNKIWSTGGMHGLKGELRMAVVELVGQMEFPDDL